MEIDKTCSAREHRLYRKGGSQYWKDMQGTPKPNNRLHENVHMPMKQADASRLEIKALQKHRCMQDRSWTKWIQAEQRVILILGAYSLPSPDSAKHLHACLRETRRKCMLKAGCFAKQGKFAGCGPTHVSS